MKRKTKLGPDKSAEQIRRALLDMSTQMLRAIEGLRHGLAVPLAEPKAASVPKATGKPRGRKPMTEAQRAAAKAERDAAKELADRAAVFSAARAAELAEVANAHAVTGVAPIRPKPQPVTRESLAAQNSADNPLNDGRNPNHDRSGGLRIAAPAEPPSYFTKAN